MRITTNPGNAWTRIAWFVGLWAAGVVSVGAVAFALRLALHAG